MLDEATMEENTTRFLRRFEEYRNFGCLLKVSEGQLSAAMAALDREPVLHGRNLNIRNAMQISRSMRDELFEKDELIRKLKKENLELRKTLLSKENNVVVPQPATAAVERPR